MKRTLAVVHSLVLLCLFLAVLPIVASAEQKEGKKEKELPKSGTLSRSVVSGTENRAVDIPWASVEGYDSGASPITGSVSQVGNGKWMMRVFNNGEDSYSVSVKVIQYNERTVPVKSDSYSFSLKPKSTEERPITAYANVKDCALELVSWKKLGGKKENPVAAQPTAAPQPPPAETGEEYQEE